ncbi:MAG TPA: DUF5652 family protein [Candidatus Paceibacterota bacterium]|nr:DUF5652 family protein [Candidatus Paceibacterota bacterium]
MWNPFVGDPIVGPLLHSVGLGILFPVFWIVLLVWTFASKALGLWYAARNCQRVWFVVFMLVHTIGILEMIYLKWYQKDRHDGNTRLFPFLKGWMQRAREMVSSRASDK